MIIDFVWFDYRTCIGKYLIEFGYLHLEQLAWRQQNILQSDFALVNKDTQATEGTPLFANVVSSRNSGSAFIGCSLVRLELSPTLSCSNMFGEDNVTASAVTNPWSSWNPTPSNLQLNSEVEPLPEGDIEVFW